MKLLLLAYDFPPLNSGGSHRPLRFVRHLPRFGITPTVLSVANYDAGNAQDASLLAQVPPDLAVHRTLLRPPTLLEKSVSGYYLRLTEPLGARWLRSALEAAERLGQKERWDALLVTCPPFSLFQVAKQISQRLNLPLFIDMRDGWSQWCLTPWATRLHYMANCWAERYYLQRAKGVFVPTRQVGQDLQRQHGARIADRWHYVPNGFDEDLAGSLRTVQVRPQGNWTFGYVGSFYYNPYSHWLIYSPWYKKKPHQFLQYVPRQEDWSYRSPLYFFRALAAMLATYPVWRGKITVRIAGKQPPHIVRMAEECGLQDVVEFCGFLAKQEIQEFYKSCDFLLSTAVKVEGGEDYCVGGKTYEYFAANKPIVGFVPPGAQRDILAGSGLAAVFEPDRVAQNAHDLHLLLSEGRDFEPNHDFLARFNPTSTVGALANVLQGFLAARPR